MTIHNLTRQKAEAHEALYPALAKLTAQIEAIAARKPAAPVPTASAAIAADLLFEAQRFLGLRRSLPEVAADMGGLATQLGRALTGLEAFELAHSDWNADLKCFVWHVRGTPMPVKRLRQMPAAAPLSAKDTRRLEQRRLELRRMIIAKAQESYDQGYADASSGHEHRGASV